MDLIESEQNNVPVEAEPRYVPKTATTSEKKTQRGQTWLRVLAVTLLAIVLIVLIVLLARWIYHKTHHKTQPVSPTSLKAPAASSRNGVSGAKPQTSSGGSSSSSPNPSSAPAGGSNSKVTNTGPGNVAAIFIGSSLAAAGLHYIISIRRFNRSGT